MVNLKRIRETVLHLSQREFAERMNIKQSRVSGMEHGDKSIGKGFAERVCNEFKIRPIEFLIDGKENINHVPIGCPESDLCQKICNICKYLDITGRKHMLSIAETFRQESLRGKKAS